MGVDAERRGSIFGPDGIHIGVVVSGEEIVVEYASGVRTQSSENRATTLDNELIPASSICLVLCNKGVGDGCETGLRNPCDVRSSPSAICQGQGDRDGYKVNIADIGKQLIGIECELAETPGFVVVGVRLVADRGFNETRSGVQEESQSGVDGKPDTTSSNAGNGHYSSGTWSSKLNAAVHSESLAG